MERIEPILCYLDPASGSIAFQVLIGGLLALVVSVRGRLRRVAGLLHWRRNKESERRHRGHGGS